MYSRSYGVVLQGVISMMVYYCFAIQIFKHKYKLSTQQTCNSSSHITIVGSSLEGSKGFLGALANNYSVMKELKCFGNLKLIKP